MVRQAPVRFGLWLYPRHAVEYHDRAVEHAQATVHFDREVDVSGCVDDIDLIAVPFGRHRGALDRDAALTLLFEVVGGGAGFAVFGVVHLDDLVLFAGVVEDPLGGRRLTRIDVRDDADVAIKLERLLSGHNFALLKVLAKPGRWDGGEPEGLKLRHALKIERGMYMGTSIRIKNFCRHR